MKNYELLTIFKPNLDADEVDKVLEKMDETLASFEGKVEFRDKMGRRKLAYEISKFRDGFFVTSTILLPAANVAEFKRQLKLNDNILRIMFLEISKKAQTV